MPNYHCHVCSEEKVGHPKVLRQGTPIWDYHNERRNAAAPPLLAEGKQCPRCYQKAYNSLNPRRNPPTEAPIPGPGETVVRTVGRTDRVCCVCGASDVPKKEVTPLVSACTWVAEEILVPSKNRTCRIHLEDGRFPMDALQSLRQRSRLVVMSERELRTNMEKLLTAAVQYIPEERKAPLDFDSDDMTEEEYVCYTGLTKPQFDELVPCLTGFVNDSINRSKRNALAIFFSWLRMDLSQDQIGHLFGLQQQRVSDMLHRVEQALTSQFAAHNVGYDHITRQEFIDRHTRKLASILFDRPPEACMLVLDGTYLEIEQSSNLELQHDSFSPHKHYNLVKPMMVCGTDGYILAVEGLYFGNNNDASILKSMLEEDQPFAGFVEEQDILVLDRGFRDNKVGLAERGIKVAMPNMMKPNQKQFDALEANESRLVTSIRWVVEVVNGHLKMIFKFFRHRICNKYLANGFLLRVVRIACAVLNKFYKLIAPDQPGDEERGKEMKERADLSNLLQELIMERGWLTARADYLPMQNEDLVDFPVLTMENLKEIQKGGTYQIRTARSYTALHVKDDEYTYHVHRQMPQLIRVRMASRYRSGVEHLLWANYRPNGRDAGSILGWYCRCQSGARTLGCCGHIMSVLWYFGFARHSRNLKFPAELLGATLVDVRMRGRQLVRGNEQEPEMLEPDT